MSLDRDSYHTWQDFLEEPPADREVSASREPLSPSTAAIASIPAAGQPSPELGTLPPGAALSARLRKLLEERQRLEHRLQVLSGAAPDDREDERRKAMFPLPPIRTKEFRIEERRLLRLDEEGHQARKRLLERRAIQRRLDQLRSEIEESARRRRLEREANRRRQAELRLEAQERARYHRRLRLIVARDIERQRQAEWAEQMQARAVNKLVEMAQARKRERLAEQDRFEELDASRLQARLDERRNVVGDVASRNAGRLEARRGMLAQRKAHANRREAAMAEQEATERRQAHRDEFVRRLAEQDRFEELDASRLQARLDERRNVVGDVASRNAGRLEARRGMLAQRKAHANRREAALAEQEATERRQAHRDEFVRRLAEQDRFEELDASRLQARLDERRNVAGGVASRNAGRIEPRRGMLAQRKAHADRREAAMAEKKAADRRQARRDELVRRLAEERLSHRSKERFA